MKFVRFKATSECIGIRRSSVVYFLLNDETTYDVSQCEHPLNSIKEIKINKACVSFLGEDFDIDHPINFTLKATSLGQELKEYCHLDIKFIELKENDIERIKTLFDERLDPEYSGEFEYILGFYYLNNDLNGDEYFKQSYDKGFRLAKKHIKEE